MVRLLFLLLGVAAQPNLPSCQVLRRQLRSPLFGTMPPLLGSVFVDSSFEQACGSFAGNYKSANLAGMCRASDDAEKKCWETVDKSIWPNDGIFAKDWENSAFRASVGGLRSYLKAGCEVAKSSVCKLNAAILDKLVTSTVKKLAVEAGMVDPASIGEDSTKTSTCANLGQKTRDCHDCALYFAIQKAFKQLDVRFSEAIKELQLQVQLRGSPVPLLDVRDVWSNANCRSYALAPYANASSYMGTCVPNENYWSVNPDGVVDVNGLVYLRAQPMCYRRSAWGQEWGELNNRNLRVMWGARLEATRRMLVDPENQVQWSAVRAAAFYPLTQVNVPQYTVPLLMDAIMFTRTALEAAGAHAMQLINWVLYKGDAMCARATTRFTAADGFSYVAPRLLVHNTDDEASELIEMPISRVLHEQLTRDFVGTSIPVLDDMVQRVFSKSVFNMPRSSDPASRLGCFPSSEQEYQARCRGSVSCRAELKDNSARVCDETSPAAALYGELQEILDSSDGTTYAARKWLPFEYFRDFFKQTQAEFGRSPNSLSLTQLLYYYVYQMVLYMVSGSQVGGGRLIGLFQDDITTVGVLPMWYFTATCSGELTGAGKCSGKWVRKYVYCNEINPATYSGICVVANETLPDGTVVPPVDNGFADAGGALAIHEGALAFQRNMLCVECEEWVCGHGTQQWLGPDQELYYGATSCLSHNKMFTTNMRDPVAPILAPLNNLEGTPPPDQFVMGQAQCAHHGSAEHGYPCVNPEVFSDPYANENEVGLPPAGLCGKVRLDGRSVPYGNPRFFPRFVRMALPAFGLYSSAINYTKFLDSLSPTASIDPEQAGRPCTSSGWRMYFTYKLVEVFAQLFTAQMTDEARFSLDLAVSTFAFSPTTRGFSGSSATENLNFTLLAGCDGSNAPPPTPPHPPVTATNA